MSPKDTPLKSSFLDQCLAEDWQATCRQYQAFLDVPSRKRFHYLGKLFEHLCPWIENAIRGVTMRHFILLPKEMVLARMFAKACKRESLPKSHVIFQIWIESIILRDVANPKNELGANNGASGEPSALLQQRFNRLCLEDRALLYLYMVERCSVAEVSSYTGIPQVTAVENLSRIWKQVQGSGAALELPRGWRAPQATECDMVHEDRNPEVD
ncbi:MAG: hypothetical protein GY747_01065 [Planctomycetes bacterium]|nr:hypothetical protein [Planctomycetota bacterium]MCP4769818.1 hypothetical protein [Planctomycetota bacterium]MCP4859658.1 hypothetical protein [Planctomycetota bacterium]